MSSEDGMGTHRTEEGESRALTFPTCASTWDVRMPHSCTMESKARSSCRALGEPRCCGRITNKLYSTTSERRRCSRAAWAPPLLRHRRRVHRSEPSHIALATRACPSPFCGRAVGDTHAVGRIASHRHAAASVARSCTRARGRAGARAWWKGSARPYTTRPNGSIVPVSTNTRRSWFSRRSLGVAGDVICGVLGPCSPVKSAPCPPALAPCRGATLEGASTAM